MNPSSLAIRYLASIVNFRILCARSRSRLRLLRYQVMKAVPPVIRTDDNSHRAKGEFRDFHNPLAPFDSFSGGARSLRTSILNDSSSRMRSFSVSVSMEKPPSLVQARYPTTESNNKKAASRAASGYSFCCRSLNYYDAFVFVKIGEHHLNYLALFRRHQLADVIRLDRQFTMLVTAVD